MLTIESTRTCGQAPRILTLLEERGVPYTLVLREEAWFLSTFGRPGPLVRDGDVERWGLGAFLHLADGAGAVAMPEAPAARALAQEWILDAWMPLGFGVAMLLGLRRAGVPADAAMGPLLGTLRRLEAALGDRPFVAGDHATPADVALLGLDRLGALVDLAPFPAVRQHAARMAARPASRRARRALEGIASPAEVLDFWLGEPATTEAEGLDKIRRWFLSGATLDAVVRERFGATVAAALDGRLADWADDAEGALALVIVLDQLTRHVHRDDPRAYAGDAMAVEVATTAIERGDLARHAELPARMFLASPWHHAEDVELQRRHEAIARAHLEGAPAHYRRMAEAGLEQSAKWRGVIERFGRFPHRNAVLGRASTPEELDFLATFAAAGPPRIARELERH